MSILGTFSHLVCNDQSTVSNSTEHCEGVDGYAPEIKLGDGITITVLYVQCMYTYFRYRFPSQVTQTNHVDRSWTAMYCT